MNQPELEAITCTMLAQSARACAYKSRFVSILLLFGWKSSLCRMAVLSSRAHERWNSRAKRARTRAEAARKINYYWTVSNLFFWCVTVKTIYIESIVWASSEGQSQDRQQGIFFQQVSEKKQKYPTNFICRSFHQSTEPVLRYFKALCHFVQRMSITVY